MKNSSKKGASIVISLGMVSVIMFFTIGIASTMMIAIKNTYNSKKALQAEYAARGGVEIALHNLSGSETPFQGEKVGDGNLAATIQYNYLVNGEDTSSETAYPDGARSIPVKGVGDAGVNCKDASVMDLDDVEYSCNWNKIYYGDSIDIPLYLIKENQTDVINPGNEYSCNQDGVCSFVGSSSISLSSFELKIRTACATWNGGNCGGRYVVDTPPGSGDDLIIAWQVNAECHVSDASNPCGISQKLGTPSAITRWNLTSAGEDYLGLNFSEIVGVNLDGDDRNAFNFLKGAGGVPDGYVHRPILKLSFIKEATAGGLNGETLPVPYFEYQVIYKSGNDSFASAYSVEVDGVSDFFKYSMSGVQDMHSPLFDFAVQN